MVLSTVREVGHYSCRSMTGNCAALAALADEPGYAQINTADAARLGIEDEALVGSFAQRQNHHPRAGQRSPKQRGDLHDLPVVDWRL